MNKVKFEDIDLTDDLGIYVASVTVSSGTAKTKVVDIPYADGVLDLTDYYSETVPLNNLKITIVGLIIDDPYSKYMSLIDAVHSKKMNIHLSQDSGHYYVGRISVGDMRITNRGTVTITCDCEPRRYTE